MKATMVTALTCLLLLAAADVRGESAALGTASGSSFSLGGSARVLAMGGAGTAAVEEPAAIWVNPAQMARLDRHAVSFMHGVWVEDVALEQIALVLPGPQGRFGVAVTVLRVRDVEGYDAAGNSTGAFTPMDISVAGGYSFESGPLAFGAAGKYVKSELAEGAVAVAGAADAGVSYRPVPNLNLSAAGLHVGSNLKYERESARMPTTLRGGAAYVFPGAGVTVAADGVKPLDGDLAVHLGVEESFALLDTVNFDLRGGWHSGAPRGDLSGASAGCGVEWAPPFVAPPPSLGGDPSYPIRGVRVDYAWTPLGELGAAHWFSFLIRF